MAIDVTIRPVHRVLRRPELSGCRTTNPLTFVDGRFELHQLVVDVFANVFCKFDREQRIRWALSEGSFCAGKVLGDRTGQLMRAWPQIESMCGYVIVQCFGVSAGFGDGHGRIA